MMKTMRRKDSLLSTSCMWGSHLLPVRSDEGEDEASVHDRQQVVEEEGQTGVEPLHQLQVLSG